MTDINNFRLRLASGQYFYLAGPIRPLDLGDVAAALSKINRFGGATVQPYSVAQHSCYVANVAAKLAEKDGANGNFVAMVRLLALLHDAHEMALSDICRPTKRWIGDTYPAFDAILQSVEAVIDNRIRLSLGLSFDEKQLEAALAHVRKADDLALRIEQIHLIVGSIVTEDDERLLAGLPDPDPMPWRDAEVLFLRHYEDALDAYNETANALLAPA